MHRLRKIPYYFETLSLLADRLINPHVLLHLIAGKRATISTREGFEFEISDLLDALVIRETIFDDVYKLSELSNPKHILDIGAGFGDFSIYASSLFPTAQIVAFEPNPDAYRLLVRNIHANRCTNITTYESAIGERPHYTLNTGSFSAMGQMSRSNGTVSVKGFSLNRYINKHVDCIKIDVEGLEVEILNGVEREKYSLVDRIVLEYHDMYIEGAKDAVVRKLNSEGFKTAVNPDRYDGRIGYVYAWK